MPCTNQLSVKKETIDSMHSFFYMQRPNKKHQIPAWNVLLGKKVLERSANNQFTSQNFFVVQNPLAPYSQLLACLGEAAVENIPCKCCVSFRSNFKTFLRFSACIFVQAEDLNQLPSILLPCFAPWKRYQPITSILSITTLNRLKGHTFLTLEHQPDFLKNRVLFSLDAMAMQMQDLVVRNQVG